MFFCEECEIRTVILIILRYGNQIFQPGAGENTISEETQRYCEEKERGRENGDPILISGYCYFLRDSM